MKTRKGKALWQIRAEKEFEADFGEAPADCIRWDEAETHENVASAFGGWDAGTYVRENDNGTTRIMRSPERYEADPRTELGITAFLLETDEGRASAIDSGASFSGVDFNPGYGAVYSEPTESENDTNPDDQASQREFTANELNREEANRVSRERFISRSIARAESLGVALSAEALRELERACETAQG